MRSRSQSCCSTAPASPPEQRGQTPLIALRCGSRDEGFADDAEDLLPRPFDHGDEAAELESRELHAALAADGDEAEVGEEVAREDRLVHLEALEGRAAVTVVVRER